MFEKILVAARGEAALRVMRTCREMGVATVAVYVAGEEGASFVRYADEAVCVGPALPDADYLNEANVISAALVTGAQAVHPGWGSLAKSPSFSRSCAENGLVFVGPDADALAFLGDGDSLRALAMRYGIPVLSSGDTSRRRRVVVPVLVDRSGSRLPLCEMHASVSRGNRVLVGESPASFLSDESRRSLGVMAQKLLRTMGYEGLAFVSFLVDAAGDSCLEDVQPWLHAAHSVVEAASGIDLVREQLLIAAGEDATCMGLVPFSRIRFSLGFCVCAEDSRRGFSPSTGTIDSLTVPAGPGIRWDGWVGPGTRVDSSTGVQMGHLVAAGATRREAISRGRRGLAECSVCGVQTTIPFHQRIVGNAAYNREDVYTDFLESEMGDLQ
ncbi:MAG: biotin carboxylase N-terminal domain-containing protein [Eggerthellaceae bacterium]